jgi:hypothetical protein
MNRMSPCAQHTIKHAEFWLQAHQDKMLLDGSLALECLQTFALQCQIVILISVYYNLILNVVGIHLPTLLSGKNRPTVHCP